MDILEIIGLAVLIVLARMETPIHAWIRLISWVVIGCILIWMLL
jgi:hypothetical protein